MSLAIAPKPGAVLALAPVPPVVPEGDLLTDAAAKVIKTAPVKPGSRPNVLFIVLDDMRTELGIYGYPTVQTPNIDALGRSGAVFENSFVSMAICAPSRTAMLTSLRPDTTGVYDLKRTIDEAVPNAITLADVFRKAGYETILDGKFFHHWWLNDDADGYSVRVGIPAEAQPGPTEFTYSNYRFPDASVLRDSKDVAQALKIFNRYGKNDKPFFMGMGIFRPHLPFYAPTADWNRYTAAAIPQPINPTGQANTYRWALSTWEVWDYDDVAPYKPKITDPKATELRWGYMAAVSYADDLVGQLMAGLKASKLLDNTIVVLWGDNGYKLGDHGHWSKHSNSEVDIHVPLIISAPTRIPAGERIKGIVEAVDLYPTLAEMAGIPVGPQVEGKSFTRLLASPGLAWKDAAFAQYNRSYTETAGLGDIMGYTVRTLNYRYTGWVNANKQLVGQELYDLVNDPTESVNVARDPRYAEAVAQLESMRVAGWRPVRDKLN